MAQTDERYFSTYCRLDITSDELEAKVGTSSVGIGTELTVQRQDYVNERGKDVCRAVVSNPRGDVVGFLPATCARRVCGLISEGWIVRIAPWALIYNSTDKQYYVEAGLIAYEPQFDDALGAFAEGCFDRMGSGERPDLKLNDKQIDAALADKKYYKSLKTVGYPKGKRDEAFYKTGRTTAETMAAEGVKGNPGCWVGTVLFYVVLAAIVAGIVWFFFLK